MIFEFDIADCCNLSCQHCVRQETNRKNNLNNRVSVNDFKKFIDLYKGIVARVKFVGIISEPLLHPELIQIIELFNENNIPVSIYTNGSVIIKNPNRLLCALNGNVKNGIYFALDGSTQELNSKYRIGSDINRILDNLKSLNNSSFELNIQHIYFNYNIGEIDRIKKLMKINQIHIDFYDIHHANQIGETVVSSVIPRKDIQSKYYDMKDKINASTSMKNIICFSKYTRTFFVTLDLKIYPCTNLYDTKSIEGFDLFDKDTYQHLLDIRDSTPFKECANSCNKIGHILEEKFQPKKYRWDEEII